MRSDPSSIYTIDVYAWCQELEISTFSINHNTYLLTYLLTWTSVKHYNHFAPHKDWSALCPNGTVVFLAMPVDLLLSRLVTSNAKFLISAYLFQPWNQKVWAALWQGPLILPYRWKASDGGLRHISQTTHDMQSICLESVSATIIRRLP